MLKRKSAMSAMYSKENCIKHKDSSKNLEVTKSQNTDRLKAPQTPFQYRNMKGQIVFSCANNNATPSRCNKNFPSKNSKDESQQIINRKNVCQSPINIKNIKSNLNL